MFARKSRIGFNKVFCRRIRIQVIQGTRQVAGRILPLARRRCAARRINRKRVQELIGVIPGFLRNILPGRGII
ncbi:Uncharacterised protein [uncultured Ruminococcus sp.]|nr:Uncharacterised protein [uncultured Ruminococcus sp.]